MPESLIGVVPSNWRLDTLGKLCADGGGEIQTGPFGSQLHASDYVLNGIPVVMPANIAALNQPALLLSVRPTPPAYHGTDSRGATSCIRVAET